jgi:DNA primase
LLQSVWWDRLTVEDHELLHALPSPYGELLAWLERDIVEHGPRPWAAIRTALVADDTLAPAMAEREATNADDFDADFADLRRLLDGRLIEVLRAEQSQIVHAASSDPSVGERYRRLGQRIAQLNARQRDEAASASAQ